MSPRVAAVCIGVVFGSIVAAVGASRRWFRRRIVPRSIAFFHPNCRAGGGGERVLWCLVQALLASEGPNATSVTVIIYHATTPLGSPVAWASAPSNFSPLKCLKDVRDRFGIDLITQFQKTSSSVNVNETHISNIQGSSSLIGNKRLEGAAECISSSTTTTGVCRRTSQAKTVPNDLANDGPVCLQNAEVAADRCFENKKALSASSLENTKEEKTRLVFVPLRSAGLLDSKFYPRLTLFLQALGAFVVAMEAVFRSTPWVFVDTSNNPFSVLAVRLLTAARCVSYVHYPTISGDMLRHVSLQRGLKARIKERYYYCLVGLYSFCFNLFMDSVVVNSSWTYAHICRLLSYSSVICSFFKSKALPIRLVYPPCDLRAFRAAALPAKSRTNRIVSVAQFRPEKNHFLQLESFSLLLDLFSSSDTHQLPEDLKLVICGAVRCAEDEELLNLLRERAQCLCIPASRIEFCVNPSFSTLCNLLGSSKVGLHTMVDEHFGISVVELLAAGLYVVAHNSGGPRTDILNLSPLLVQPRGGHTPHLSKRGQNPSITFTPVEVEVEEGLVMLSSPRTGRRTDSCHSGRGTRASATETIPSVASTVPVSPHVPPCSRQDSDVPTSGSFSTDVDILGVNTPVANSCTARTGTMELASYGFLCSSSQGFAQALFVCLTSPPPTLLSDAQESLSRFNDDNAFGTKAIDALQLCQLLSA